MLPVPVAGEPHHRRITAELLMTRCFGRQKRK
jgi:hypothetical protein